MQEQISMRIVYIEQVATLSLDAKLLKQSFKELCVYNEKVKRISSSHLVEHFLNWIELTTSECQINQEDS